MLPWKRLEKKIKPFYPKAGNGRRPYPLSIMLRIHCLQLFYNLSDPAMEDALYEIESMRRFAGLKITDSIPDETTIHNFRHLLEQNYLGEKLFETINQQLTEEGMMLKEGTIVDATIISAPTSTKNKNKSRDPEMHQTKKGNEWKFGMKMHIGTDDALGLIHSVETSSANVHDITAADQLLHGEEDHIWGDSGYVGIEKRSEHEDRDVEWHIARRPSHVKDGLEKLIETTKAKVRAKVEPRFCISKEFLATARFAIVGWKRIEIGFACWQDFTT